MRKKLKEHWRCYVINYEGISQKRWDTGCLQPLMFLLLFFSTTILPLFLSLCLSAFYNLKWVMNPNDLSLSLFSVEEIRVFNAHCNARAFLCLLLRWVGNARTIEHPYLRFSLTLLHLTSSVHHCHKFMQKHTLSFST